MDKAVIEMAKKFADDQGQSLSNLVENYFKLVTGSYKSTNSVPQPVEEDPTPYTTDLLSSLKAPKDYDYNYKRDLQLRREKKYLE
jgi:hypothetical protein